MFLNLSHANAEILDGDRGKLEDRQRNEMKTQTTAAWYKLNGNWDEATLRMEIPYSERF